jgi:adenine-specific DNA-methyltransferase
MQLQYPNKKSINEILANSPVFKIENDISKPNLLIEGENFTALQLLRNYYTGKIDLIYIDPPFATGNNFTIGNDRASTISQSLTDTLAYSDKLVGYEFLEFLRERLIVAKELLSEQGSIYLHIDYKIGHYVKIIMDEVFGVSNFKNDITRIKCNPKNFSRKAYGNIKDMLLFYTKSDKAIWNEVKMPYTNNDKEKLFKKVDKNGKAYTTIPLHAPGETKNGPTSEPFKGILPPKGRNWRCSPAELEELDRQGLIEWSVNGNPRKIIYADEQEGKKIQDIWELKDPVYPDYPTEKNSDLLKLIIETSSNENSIVLDFFCGSGTTLAVANQLNRKWLGIDQSPQAIKATKNKLNSLNNNLFLVALYNFLKIENDTLVACRITEGG